MIKVAPQSRELVVAPYRGEKGRGALRVKLHTFGERFERISLDEHTVCDVGIHVDFLPFLSACARVELAEQQAVLSALSGNYAAADGGVKRHAVLPGRVVKDLPPEGIVAAALLSGPIVASPVTRVVAPFGRTSSTAFV